ncbi:protein translocase subunit secY/sec61 alpha [Mycoplasmopsis mustelae]|uniref:Protein translocase subunit SecY n=1 Tax=Mycoplasmopsis mustelae TaxID=171289 RepID=A0A4R7UE31_9BACT|nr:preprotein translocase subunit SecY [Mycoplasmopsis mustelae]TDV24336.1 protein translocase subunit secY/sec61 alpha [Mycoplasmopsis mustelae]
MLNISNLWYKFTNHWKGFWVNKNLTKKIIFTLVMLTIFVLGTTITAPFIRISNPSQLSSNSFLNTLNLIGGGGLRQFSLLALGISPFINASLIMMILQSKIVPPIHRMSQSGPQGRKKINVITRFITLLIAYPQAIFLTRTLSSGAPQSIFIQIVGTQYFSENLLVYFIIPTILVAASLFALFISEQITNKGVGNGTSLIIFTGIASRLPFQFQSAVAYYIGDGGNIMRGVVSFFAYVLVYVVVIIIIAIVYVSERHIPIQQVGAGRSKTRKEMGKLPIKANPGGIMPIIFAMLVLSFPTMIANVLPNSSPSKQWINTNLQFTQPIGFTLLIIIILVFSVLMGIQQSKVDKIAEDFSKNSTFIPGVRPGEETQDYLVGIVFRLSVFSALYLLILGSMQFVSIMLHILPPVIAFGGTGLMILVSTSLETLDQLKARNKSNRLSKAKRLTQQNYENININNSNNNKNTNDAGLLW